MDDDSIRWWPIEQAEADGESSPELDQRKGVERPGEKRVKFEQVIGFKGSEKKCKVYYALAKSNNKFSGRLLKLKKLTIKLPQQPKTSQLEDQRQQHSDEQTAGLILLIQHIEDILEERRKHRPGRLLIYVNPFGGKGRALHLYKTQVRRLFEIANVEVKLIITKYANHARDTIEDPQFNVEYFDGIICVGGDGMFSELMNGLLFRYNREKILLAQHAKSNDNANNEGPQADNHDEDPHDPNGFANADYDQRKRTTANKMTTNMTPANIQTSGHNDDNKASKNITNHDDDDGGNCNNSEKTSPTTKQTSSPNQAQIDDAQLLKLRLALGGIGKQFISPPIPVGVIGAGSTDANSFGLLGTNDVITAALNIILGNQINIDVCSVHSLKEDKLLKFVSTFVAYGYFGDVVRESEKFRWMGPSRYDVTGFNNLIRNRTYNGLVRILTSDKDGTPLESARCHKNCELCCFEQQEVQGSKPTGEELLLNQTADKIDNFKVIEKAGSFVGVNAAVTACRCPKTKKGFSPNNHLANGCADLILVMPCTRLQYIRYLLRVGLSNKSAFDLKYVEAFRCRQFEFVAERREETKQDKPEQKLREQPWSSSSLDSAVLSASSSSSTSTSRTNVNQQESKHSTRASCEPDNHNVSMGSSWNADGEILEEQSIRVKVNNQLLRVFGTGEP